MTKEEKKKPLTKNFLPRIFYSFGVWQKSNHTREKRVQSQDLEFTLRLRRQCTSDQRIIKKRTEVKVGEEL